MMREDYKKKWIQFKDYYMKTVLLIAVLILFGLYILYETVFAYREPALTVLIVSTEDMNTKSIEKELQDKLDVGYVEVEQLNIGANIERTLAARFVAGDMDLFIAQEDVFEYYAEKDVMEDLSECLTPDLYEKLKEKEVLKDFVIQEETVDGEFIESGKRKTVGAELNSEKVNGDGENFSTEKNLLIGIVKTSEENPFQGEAFAALTVN